MVPVIHISLETPSCPAIPQRGFLSSFLCQALRKGSIRGQPGGGGMLMAQGLGLLHLCSGRW